MADDTLTPAAAVATPAAPVVAPVAEPASPSHRDWNQMAQNVRQANDRIDKFMPLLEQVMAKMVTPSVTPAPVAEKPTAQATAPDPALVERLSRMERELAVNKAIADHGLSGEQRTAFEELAAYAPTEKIVEIAAKVAKLKPSAVAALTTPVVAPGSSNTGPAAASVTPIVADKITDIPKDVWQALSPQEKREKYEKQMRVAGRGNPFAAARDAGRK